MGPIEKTNPIHDSQPFIYSSDKRGKKGVIFGDGVCSVLVFLEKTNRKNGNVEVAKSQSLDESPR